MSNLMMLRICIFFVYACYILCSATLRLQKAKPNNFRVAGQRGVFIGHQEAAMYGCHAVCNPKAGVGLLCM